MTTQPQSGSPSCESLPSADVAGGARTGVFKILDDLADACMVVEPCGRMRYANESARTLLRMQGRATGRKLAAVLAERRALDVFEDAAAALRPRIAMLPLTFSSDGPRLYTFSAVPFEIAGEGRFLRVALSASTAPAAHQGTGEAAAVLEKLGDPLSIIQGYLENLLDGVIKEPAILRQCLGAMQRQATQMQRVLSTLRA
jgi:signal transduction histidine kinase